jgi:SAM-dependent methyltransferase
MANAVDRFAGIAAAYDAARPHPPAALADVLRQWSGAGAPDVVDVGAGTGLSTILWAGRAATVTAVEPGDDMRAIAARRVGLAAGSPADPAGQDAGQGGGTTTFAVIAGSAETTGLPDNCADIVTASQAMHWFDADRALPEIVRILRPGGVFAAYDCDWPPCIDWEIDVAYTEFTRRMTALEVARGLQPPHAGKRHLETIRASGLFRHATEIALHSREEGDAQRLIDAAMSQGGAAALAEAGVPEDEFGLANLREVAARRLPAARPWYWTYRVRMGVTGPAA